MKGKENEIQDINTYTNANLIPPLRFRSARYPITHKALITQLISIYLITPSLPGTISTGPGRESLLLHPAYNLSRSTIIRLSLSLLRCSFDPSRKSSTRPCYSHSYRNANRSRVDVPLCEMHRGLYDSS